MNTGKNYTTSSFDKDNLFDIGSKKKSKFDMPIMYTIKIPLEKILSWLKKER